jgi:hypothetical protein
MKCWCSRQKRPGKSGIAEGYSPVPSSFSVVLVK